MPQPDALHIFFAGTHTATDGTRHEFTEAAIADLAESYDPALSGAPLVVGHPKLDDPAYGSVSALRVDGKHLYAVPAEVEPQFAELVNAGRFPKISASIYLPDSPGNPKPGHHYLRHVGFLGAAAPSLKGLKRPQLSFGASDAAPEFALPLGNRIRSIGSYLKRLFQGLRDQAIETGGVEKADQIIPQWCIDGIAEVTADDDEPIAQPAYAAPAVHQPDPETIMTDPTAEFAEAQARLQAQQADIEQREAALLARERDAQRDDIAQFAEQLVQSGKLLPRHKPGVIELLLALPAGTVLNFAEADGQEPTAHDAGDTLRALLEDLPQVVQFAEKSPARHTGTTTTADFALPAGTQADATRMELHAKARAYMQANPGTDIITAAKAVGG